jgi:hypothetical protein
VGNPASEKTKARLTSAQRQKWNPSTETKTKMAATSRPQARLDLAAPKQNGEEHIAHMGSKEKDKGCLKQNLMAHVKWSKTLSRKAKSIAFLSKATKMSETTK